MLQVQELSLQTMISSRLLHSLILFTDFARCRIWELISLRLQLCHRISETYLTLLSATEEMVTDYADRPIITMSMAGTGVISRLCGEVFGSSMTFGAAKKASAPGQMGVEDLSTVLGLLHKSM